MSEVKYYEELTNIIYSNVWLMNVLRTSRECDLPDWFVAAGAIRSIVWDKLHGYKDPTPISDVDVIFYDRYDLTQERDKKAEVELSSCMPSVEWDAKNQAAVHLWYEDVFGFPIEPIVSSEDAINRWSPASIGVRLLLDDSLYIYAPYGLTDLFEMKFRRNQTYIPIDSFLKKVKKSAIKEKWPMAQIVWD
ncbi:MAG TPA: nucleotidyltransferase family protein [Clostridia bacterium]|nr:nucleotidyltransferase family protein [Clostridia bacterium]